jgi:hypothetical protein
MSGDSVVAAHASDQQERMNDVAVALDCNAQQLLFEEQLE